MRAFRPRPWLLMGLAALLLLSACSKPAGSPPPPAPMPEAPLASPAPAPAPLGPREQAHALLREGKPLEAIALLRELTAREPSADHFSDLSHAYLAAREHKLAREAAEQAVRLDGTHGGARYHLGLALLELKEWGKASTELSRSALLQPERFEPHAALVRAYAEMRQGTLANYHLREAERLAPGNPQVQAVAPAAAALWQRDKQQVPKGSCHAGNVELTYTLCLAAAGEEFYDLYLVPASLNLLPERLSLGRMQSPEQSITPVTLPGSVPGYWVMSYHHVYEVYQWRLFTVKDSRLQPVVVLVEQDPFTPVADHFLSSMLPPSIEGALIRSSTVDPSRTGRMHYIWQLSPDLTTAVLISSERTEGRF